MNDQEQPVVHCPWVLWTILGIVAAAWASGVVGCSIFNPAGQTQAALTQSKIYEWREDGGFWVEGKGTQEEEFTMLQRVIPRNADGTLNLEAAVTEYSLHAEPSARPAVDASAIWAQNSLEQTQSINELLRALIDRLPSLGGTPATEGDGG